MAVTSGLRVEAREDGWVLGGEAGHPQDLGLCNDYLGYLADRHYAAGTRRSYAFDLLGFARWLSGQQLRLDAVDTAAVRDWRRRRRIGDWLRSVGCSRSGRCEIPRR